MAASTIFSQDVFTLCKQYGGRGLGDMYLDNIPYQAPTMELFAEIANCYFCKKSHLIFEICLKWF